MSSQMIKLDLEEKTKAKGEHINQTVCCKQPSQFTDQRPASTLTSWLAIVVQSHSFSEQWEDYYNIIATFKFKGSDQLACM